MLYRTGRSLGPGITDDTADGPRLASTPRRTASLSTSDAVNAPCRTTHTSQPKASESHSASESSPIALRTSPQSRSSKTLNNTQLDNARTPTMITTRIATLRMVRARDADPCSAGSASAAEVNAGPAGSSAMRRGRYQPRDRPLGSPSWGYSLGASNSGMGARPRHGRADHPGDSSGQESPLKIPFGATDESDRARRSMSPSNVVSPRSSTSDDTAATTSNRLKTTNGCEVMRNIDKVKKTKREVELLQSALAGVHGGLDTVETMVETADEVRRGVRRLLKLGLVFVVVGVAVAVVLRLRRARDPKPTSNELHSG